MNGVVRGIVISVILMAASVTLADISKCVDAEGNITYTDAGCPEDTREVAKIPEVKTAESKQLKPKVPLKTRLDRLLDKDTYSLRFNPYGVIALYGVMSLVCFGAYFRDKRQARNGQWRTPESTLHLLEMLGGWPGGLVAQQVLRHKNRKLSYQVVFWGIVALHGMVWADVWTDHQISRGVLEFLESLV